MSVGFGVSLVVRGETVDPAGMLATVAAAVDANHIEILRVGDVVRLTADEVPDLSVLAVPLAAWWQQHGPTTAGDVALRFVGPNGITELTYSSPDLAVEHVRHTIEVDSGRPYGPGEAPAQHVGSQQRRCGGGPASPHRNCWSVRRAASCTLFWQARTSTTGHEAWSFRYSAQSMTTTTLATTTATAW